MYDKEKIIPGLIVFVLIAVFPILYNRGNAGHIPNPEKPKAARECVRPVQDMRERHMQLLIDWRTDVIRDNGARYATAAGGTRYARSLQLGCMKCHDSKRKFCDECHNYAAVKPYCWDCHIEPKENM